MKKSKSKDIDLVYERFIKYLCYNNIAFTQARLLSSNVNEEIIILNNGDLKVVSFYTGEPGFDADLITLYRLKNVQDLTKANPDQRIFNIFVTDSCIPKTICNVDFAEFLDENRIGIIHVNNLINQAQGVIL